MLEVRRGLGHARFLSGDTRHDRTRLGWILDRTRAMNHRVAQLRILLPGVGSLLRCDFEAIERLDQLAMHGTLELGFCGRRPVRSVGGGTSARDELIADALEVRPARVPRRSALFELVERLGQALLDCARLRARGRGNGRFGLAEALHDRLAEGAVLLAREAARGRGCLQALERLHHLAVRRALQLDFHGAGAVGSIRGRTSARHELVAHAIEILARGIPCSGALLEAIERLVEPLLDRLHVRAGRIALTCRSTIRGIARALDDRLPEVLIFLAREGPRTGGVAQPLEGLEQLAVQIGLLAQSRILALRGAVGRARVGEQQLAHPVEIRPLRLASAGLHLQRVDCVGERARRLVLGLRLLRGSARLGKTRLRIALARLGLARRKDAGCLRLQVRSRLDISRQQALSIEDDELVLRPELVPVHVHSARLAAAELEDGHFLGAELPVLVAVDRVEGFQSLRQSRRPTLVRGTGGCGEDQAGQEAKVRDCVHGRCLGSRRLSGHPGAKPVPQPAQACRSSQVTPCKGIGILVRATVQGAEVHSMGQVCSLVPSAVR